MAVEIALALWREFGYDISDDAILQGLADARMPARIEVLRRHPLLLLDGCHNPDGAKMLAATLTRADFEENLVGVLGVLADKDYKDMLSDLAPCFAKIYTVTPNCPRALSAEELQKEHASTPTPRPPTVWLMPSARPWTTRTRTTSRALLSAVRSTLLPRPARCFSKKQKNNRPSPFQQNTHP